MRCYRQPFFWLMLSMLLTCATASAQIFTPTPRVSPLNENEGRGPAPRVGHYLKDRVQIAAYVAQWDYPPLHLSFQTTPAPTITQDFRPGPLLTADFFLAKEFSVGGYWNRFTGEVRQTGDRELPSKLADVDGTSWDIHGTYYPPERWARDWSLQVGYTTVRTDYTLSPDTGLRNQRLRDQSIGIWVNRTQRIGPRRGNRPGIGPRKGNGPDRRFVLFGSAGYYTSSHLNRAWNVTVGGAVPVIRHVSLGASVWFNDLTGSTRIRTSVGLSGSY